jgi:hypothetical protein
MQTAVEFLDERYTYIKWMRDRDEISWLTAADWYSDALNKALEMEKKQIFDAFNQGYREGEKDGDDGVVSFKDVSEFNDAENYWQRTYGTNVPICGCGNCTEHYQHKSDCAVHNMPAMPNGQCDCNSNVPKQNQ